MSGKVRKFDKIKKNLKLSVYIYKDPSFPNPSNGKKLIKNPLKSD